MSIGPRTWSSRSWRCTRRAVRTCRWIRCSPAERLAMIAEDAALHVLVTQDALIGDDRGRRTDGRGARPRPPALSPRSTIRTSGIAVDTVRPRVRHLHVRLDRAAEGRRGHAPSRSPTSSTSMRRPPGPRAEHDVLLAVTTMSFDIAGLELFLPLTSRRHASCSPARRRPSTRSGCASGSAPQTSP